jgi:lipopolysaccharide transport system permease protein
MDAILKQDANRSAVMHAVHVVWYRAIAELRAEATRTYAGYLWWIIQPLLMFFVYFIAFRYVLNVQQENYAVFLFSGIILWQWFSVTVQRCAGSLIASRALMLQVNLHKSVFPLSIIIVNSVKFMVTLLILVSVLFMAGIEPGLAWIALPAVLIVQLMLIAACGCFSAMLSPFVPDFQHILATLLHLAFFVSGILYDLSVLPEKYQRILGHNPMAVIIEESRNVLLLNLWPDFIALATQLIIAASILSVSMLLIHRFDKVYPKLS